jgi:Spectrin repeat
VCFYENVFCLQVAEINANTERIQQFSKDGREMIVRKHFASPRVAVLLEEMLTKWEDLAGKAEARNNKFEQAAKARGFYGLVDTAKSRLTQIQLMLEEPNSDENSDPRKLRSELKNAESNIKHAETMVERVRNDAEFLAANNHFNGPKLLKTAGELDGQLRKLHEPAKRRWLQLDEIVQQNQTAGDLEKEIAWIEERLKLLKTTHDGKSSVVGFFVFFVLKTNKKSI